MLGISAWTSQAAYGTASSWAKNGCSEQVRAQPKGKGGGTLRAEQKECCPLAAIFIQIRVLHPHPVRFAGLAWIKMNRAALLTCVPDVQAAAHCSALPPDTMTPTLAASLTPPRHTTPCHSRLAALRHELNPCIHAPAGMTSKTRYCSCGGRRRWTPPRLPRCSEL